MSAPPGLSGLYAGWAEQQRLLLDSIGPLSAEQMELRAAPGEWAIWQLASNMVGARLYWLCHMLGEDDLGVSAMFRVDHTTVPDLPLEWAGWEDDTCHPRSAAELVHAFEEGWRVIESCLARWDAAELDRPRAATNWLGREMAVTPGEALWRLMSHEVHHGSEISLILRVHGLPTALNR